MVLDDPPLAGVEEIKAVHDPLYVDQYINGTLDPAAIRKIGIQWSPRAVERSRRVVGATCAAAELSLSAGASIVLAGGQHHAHKSFGSGYCVFNDIVIAAERLVKQKKIRNWLSIDLDVHQGDGTASMTEGKDHIFTFSMHAKNNFPLKKAQSSLDVELEDGAEDAVYLRRLDETLHHLKQLIRDGTLKCDLIMYQAGVDVMKGDNLGRMALSLDGVRKRDQMVTNFALEIGQPPIAACIGGGYPSKAIQDPEQNGMNRIVQAHAQTVKALLKYAGHKR